jgi:hypothetical protein
VLVAAVQTLPALPKSVDVIEQPPAEESARALEVAAEKEGRGFDRQQDGQQRANKHR